MHHGRCSLHSWLSFMYTGFCLLTQLIISCSDSTWTVSCPTKPGKSSSCQSDVLYRENGCEFHFTTPFCLCLFVSWSGAVQSFIRFINSELWLTCIQLEIFHHESVTGDGSWAEWIRSLILGCERMPPGSGCTHQFSISVSAVLWCALSIPPSWKKITEGGWTSLKTKQLQTFKFTGKDSPDQGQRTFERWKQSFSSLLFALS